METEENNRVIDLRPQYLFVERHAGKVMYVIMLIVGMGLIQLMKNVELTLAVGLAVRIMMEVTGAFVFLGLMALGGWVALQLLTGKNI
jgi:hypothetical protein